MKVKDLIALLEGDGWVLIRTKGSHRQYHHPNKSGTVTVSGKPSVDIPIGTLSSALKQAGLKKLGVVVMRYLVILEEGPSSFGAYVPDLPGCVAVGDTREKCSR